MVKNLIKVFIFFLSLNLYSQEVTWTFDNNFQDTGKNFFSTSTESIIDIIKKNKSSFNLPIPIKPNEIVDLNFFRSTGLSSQLEESNNILTYRAVSKNSKIKVVGNEGSALKVSKI